MYEKKLPFGEPFYFKGKYEVDKVYDLYIQNLCCSFEIKEGKIPTIQLKNSRFFLGNEYLTSSNNEIVSLTLTNIDLELFFENYNVYDLTYFDGYKFRSKKGFFNEYIEKYIKIKNDATISGNKGMRTIAKLMLNSLYGKFALSLETTNKKPYLEENVVHYVNQEKEERDGLYIPVGAFITAYAREKTIRASQAIKDYSIKKYNKDLYVYSDTDSIHTLLSIEECKKILNIDDVKLGFWKHENTFKKGKYIRQKTYVNENYNNELEITCAGMPKKCIFKKTIKRFNLKKYNFVSKEKIKTKKYKRSYYFLVNNTSKKIEKFTLDKFKKGFSCGGNLQYKHVEGGVLLVDDGFTIKYDKLTKFLDKKVKG